MRTLELRRREVLGAVALSTVAGCVGRDAPDGDDGGDGVGRAGRRYTVGVGGDEMGFDPDRLVIAPGDTVVWERRSAPHWVRLSATDGERWTDEFGLEDGDPTYEHTFGSVGTYSFECTRHMEHGASGEIEVVEPEEHEVVDVAVGSDGTASFEPERVEIEADTTVVWTWDSDGHTVTPTSTPRQSLWTGHTDAADAGTEHLHTFEVAGTYEYECDGHDGAGATGEIAVATPEGDVPVEIVAGPDGDLAFEPERVEVEPGQTVRWIWGPDFYHSISPVSVPDGAEWEGHPEPVERWNVYEHRFEVEGTYEYECSLHGTTGMNGTIVVREP